jgi:hypothetical protein
MMEAICSPERPLTFNGLHGVTSQKIVLFIAVIVVVIIIIIYVIVANEDEIDRACRTHRQKRNAYRILVGKLEGKRPLGRAKHRWKDNIKMDLR